MPICIFHDRGGSVVIEGADLETIMVQVQDVQA